MNCRHLLGVVLFFPALCLADETSAPPATPNTSPPLPVLLFRGATNPGDLDKVLHYEAPSDAEAQVKVLSRLAELGVGHADPADRARSSKSPEVAEGSPWKRTAAGWLAWVIFFQVMVLAVRRWRRRAWLAARDADENTRRAAH